jgi:hypothetical protein
MNEEIFYRKVGKRYKPVGFGEFPRFGQGSHLVVVDDGWTFTRTNIEPDRAALLAATKLATEKVVGIISKACKAKYEIHEKKVAEDPSYREKAIKAWEGYCEAMGDNAPMQIWFQSASDTAEEIVSEMLKVAHVPKVTVVYHGDWEGIYIDGKLCLDSVKVFVATSLNIVGFHVEEKYADKEWFDDRRSLPSLLSECKFEVNDE